MKKIIQGLGALFLVSIFFQCSPEDAGSTRKIPALTGTWKLTRYQSDQISTTYKSSGQKYEVKQSFTAKNLDYQVIFGGDGKVHSRGSFQLLNSYELNGKTNKRTIPISPSSLGRGLFAGKYVEQEDDLVIQNEKGKTVREFVVLSASHDEIKLQSPLENTPFLDLIQNPISLEKQEVKGDIHIRLERVE